MAKLDTLQNKVVWITGASSGLGKALAGEFALQGAQVILTSRRFEELEEVLKVNYYGSVNVTYKNHVYKTNVNNKDEYFIYNLYSDYLIQSYDNHFKSQTDKYDYFSDLLINTGCYKVFFKSFTSSLETNRSSSKFILHLTNKFLNQLNLTWN